MIVTDGPNIYEKKRQRFERIQRMRQGESAQQSQNGCTPSGETAIPHGNNSSSCLSGNYLSLVKYLPDKA